MDETERKGGGGGFLLGLVVGAFAGAAAGLLWAPRSGPENRDKLAEALPALGTTAPEESAAVPVTSPVVTSLSAGPPGPDLVQGELQVFALAPGHQGSRVCLL